MKLNDEQRAAAFCNENAVVAAGAGSGKTMVLASRFAWLITEKKLKVSEILTLTFTTKATAQMYRRIHALLSEIAGGEAGEADKACEVGSYSLEAKEAAACALEDFVHARIQTLDSYCTSVVKQGAARYGISPGFSIDQSRCHALALEVSLPFLITHRRHPAVEKLYYGNKPVQDIHVFFAKILFEYTRIDKEHDFILDVKKQFDTVCALWKNKCESLAKIAAEIESLANDDAKLFPDVIPLLDKYKKTNNGSLPELPGALEIRRYFDLLLETESGLESGKAIEASEAHPLQKSFAASLKFFSEVCKLNLRGGKQKDNTIKEKIKQIRASFGEFSSLAVYCMQAGFMISITSLVQTLALSYLEKKRLEKILTFSDVAQLARAILLEQHDIRQGEKESFKAIMVDEFQDNNELQKDMFFLLAEKLDITTNGIPDAKDLCEGKLFFVGDEKQSVYLFRGADVSVFRKLKTALQASELSLKTNYRSSAALIGAFNSLFGGSAFDPYGNLESENPSVFALGENLPLYEAEYAPLKAAPGKTGGGKLSVCFFDTKTDAEADSETATELAAGAGTESEARFVALRVSKLLEEKTEEGLPKYLPADIALLFRTRSSQHLFEKHLRYLDIPYTSEDINDFFYGGVVNDIMSVLRLVAYPQDIAAYAQMLRSPFAGLSLAALADCLSVFKSQKDPHPFDERPLKLLSPGDMEKYQNGQKIYRLIKKAAASENISSLVNELWHNQGYRYETEWNGQVRAYGQLFDYLFHLAAAADAKGQGLAAFTDSIEVLRASGGRLSEIEIPLKRSQAVNLLTVHKSKGLEYPVVFLCSCGKSSRHDSASEVFFSKETGLIFSAPVPPSCSSISGIRGNFFWENIKALEKNKKTAELRRLLYVGMTRAEKELYLTGCLGIGASGGGDFSQSVKKYVGGKTKFSKCANGGEGVSDYIIDNDTFFGLCLPALAAHIGQDAFFNIEEIPLYTDDDLSEAQMKVAKKRFTGKNSDQGQFFANDQNGLDEFLKTVRPFYETAKVLETPVLPSRHFTPAALRNFPELIRSFPAALRGLPAALRETLGNLFAAFNKDGDPEGSGEPKGSLENTENAPQEGSQNSGNSQIENPRQENIAASRDFSGENSDDIFNKIDTMLARFNAEGGGRKNRFNSGSFGTIAHICVAAMLEKKEPQIPQGIAGFLTPAETDVFLQAGNDLARRFIQCPLGEAAQKSRLRESELAFRSIVKDADGGSQYFISGTIDLLFEDEEAVHVVDFKTDSQEIPSEHFVQMAMYYRAANDLFAVPLKKTCRIWLYYLRSGHAVELTDKVKNGR